MLFASPRVTPAELQPASYGVKFLCAVASNDAPWMLH